MRVVWSNLFLQYFTGEYLSRVMRIERGGGRVTEKEEEQMSEIG